MDLFLSSFASVLSPESFLIIAAGVFIGIIFGALPGLSTAMAVALCLPITYTMSATHGISMIMGLFIGGVSGGLITAILLNIPGTAASLATTFDGHPMANKGQAGRALGIGICFSFIGTIIGIIAIVTLSPILADFALQFSPVEYFAISVFSLTMMASLSGKSLVKGLITGCFGMYIAMFGLSPIDSIPRFTFGTITMRAGFGMVSVLTGIFALAEILTNTTKSQNITKDDFVDCRIKGLGFSFKEFVSQIPNAIRSAVIGIAIGILPGVGAGTGNLIAYTTAKNSSKTPEKFGTGCMDGIVASETSNNATVCGAIIPLLTLGVPGDIGTALLLGALMIHGIVPGPLLLTTNAELVYTIFAALFVATVLMFVMEFFGIRVLTKVLTIKKYILMPVIMILCCVGAFGNNNRVFDVVWLAIFGIIGYILRKFDFPVAPLIIGYILGPMAETNLRRALMASDGSLVPFVTSPIAMFFFIIAIISITYTIVKQVKGSKVNAK